MPKPPHALSTLLHLYGAVDMLFTFNALQLFQSVFDAAPLDVVSQPVPAGTTILAVATNISIWELALRR